MHTNAAKFGGNWFRRTSAAFRYTDLTRGAMGLVDVVFHIPMTAHARTMTKSPQFWIRSS